MSLKRTLITALFFLVILGVFLLDKRRTRTAETAKDVASQVLAFEAKGIDKLTLKNASGSFELVKDAPAENAKDKKEAKKEEAKAEGEAEDSWSLVKPIKTRADEATVRTLIADLASARKTEPFTLSGKQKLADYGLEKPVAELEFRSAKDGKFDTICLGESGARPGANFARLTSKKDEIFLIQSSLKTNLENGLYNLRDKDILECPSSLVNKVELKSSRGLMTASKKDEEWTLDTPENSPGAKTAIDALLTKIDGGRAADFVDASAASQPASYGLEKPQITLTVMGAGFDKGRTLLVGDKAPEEERYYAKSSTADQVFMIPQDIFTELNKPFAEYKSKELFPRLTGAASVGSAAIESTKKGSIKLAKKDGKWTLEGGPEGTLDQGSADDLVAALAGLRVSEYISDPATSAPAGPPAASAPVKPPSADMLAKYGFDKPAMKIALADLGGKIKAEAEIGKIDEEAREIYARRSGYPAIFKLTWVAPDTILKSGDDLRERLLAKFKPEDVSEIDIAKGLKTEKPTVWHFEKDGAVWKGRKGSEGKPQSVPNLEMTSFLDAFSQVRYKARYEKGSQDLEKQLAPLGDTETTVTLKDASKKAILDVGVTPTQFDLRWARQRDGVAYSIQHAQFERASSAADALRGAIKDETEEGTK